MKQYIRTNSDNEKVIDFDLLDMAGRINFMEEAKRFASDLEVDLSCCNLNTEKAHAINSAVIAQSEYAFDLFTDDGNEVIAEANTKKLWIEIVIEELEERYSVDPVFVNTSDRYGDHALVTIKTYKELNPDGEFWQNTDGIYETIDGLKEQIAERNISC